MAHPALREWTFTLPDQLAGLTAHHADVAQVG